MSKYSQQVFIPKNPQKIVGNKRPFSRSSWELRVMSFLDEHPNVIQWGSECVRIPYVNPLTGKSTIYVPDFLIKYADAKGTQRVELVEVKPKKETFIEAAKSKRDKAYVILNTAKWTAALKFCERHGIKFRILNEDDIFVTKVKAKARKR
jgi:hypothetical protein